jgi:PAS domain S-box-containing protein
MTIPTYSAGGIMAPGIMSQMSVILTAGFLLGWRGGLAVGLLTMATDFGLAYMEIAGMLPAPSVVHTPITRWIGAVIPFGTILALQYYATNHLRSSLTAMQNEIVKREAAEKKLNQTVTDLKERVKELKTLSDVSHILQDEDSSPGKLFQKIVEILPLGWQYPDITAGRISIGGTEYTTRNYKSSEYTLLAETKTTNGTQITVELVYLQPMPLADEGPFLKEERHLINMLIEMIETYLARHEHSKELKDYKYALDMSSLVSISGVDGTFMYINENFCKVTKYAVCELLHKKESIILSGDHSDEYFQDSKTAIQLGKPYRGEFCNKTKDGTLYWVDTSVVPFLNESGEVYQYLSISYEITERRVAEEKIKQSEQVLRRITSQVPANVYMFELDEEGKFKILFMSRGTDLFNHSVNHEDVSQNSDLLGEMFHPDDKAVYNDMLKEAFRTQSAISFQYRMLVNDQIRWRYMQAIPVMDTNGKVVWYGATNDITPMVDYIASIEQFLFDIGHVIRRPISTMMGLTSLVIDSDLAEYELKEISKKLRLVSEEMDNFVRELNVAYNKKRQSTKFKIDTSALIDKRGSLFKTS